jgi:hypothetical protein
MRRVKSLSQHTAHSSLPRISEAILSSLVGSTGQSRCKTAAHPLMARESGKFYSSLA